jgi:hypothetical protein
MYVCECVRVCACEFQVLQQHLTHHNTHSIRHAPAFALKMVTF